MSQHVLSGFNIRQEHAVQVDVDDLHPLLISHFFRRSVDADTCVVVAEIQAAEFIHNLLHHRFDLCLVRAVALDCDHLPSCRVSKLLSCFHSLIIVKIHDRHIRAGFRKACRRALADTSGRARYEALLPIKPHALNDSHLQSPFIN